MEVRCEDDGQWYQAIVEHENSDGTFTVRFDKDGFESLGSWFWLRNLSTNIGPKWEKHQTKLDDGHFF